MARVFLLRDIALSNGAELSPSSVLRMGLYKGGAQCPLPPQFLPTAVPDGREPLQSVQIRGFLHSWGLSMCVCVCECEARCAASGKAVEVSGTNSVHVELLFLSLCHVYAQWWLAVNQRGCLLGVILSFTAPHWSSWDAMNCGKPGGFGFLRNPRPLPSCAG